MDIGRLRLAAILVLGLLGLPLGRLRPLLLLGPLRLRPLPLLEPGRLGLALRLGPGILGVPLGLSLLLPGLLPGALLLRRGRCGLGLGGLPLVGPAVRRGPGLGAAPLLLFLGAGPFRGGRGTLGVAVVALGDASRSPCPSLVFRGRRRLGGRRVDHVGRDLDGRWRVGFRLLVQIRCRRLLGGVVDLWLGRGGFLGGASRILFARLAGGGRGLFLLLPGLLPLALLRRPGFFALALLRGLGLVALTLLCSLGLLELALLRGLRRLPLTLPRGFR